MTQKRKRFQIKSACPQCGCSFATHLSREEMMKRYGNVPHIELECGECAEKFETDIKSACPEWDKECKINE